MQGNTLPMSWWDPCGTPSGALLRWSGALRYRSLDVPPTVQSAAANGVQTGISAGVTGNAVPVIIRKYATCIQESKIVLQRADRPDEIGHTCDGQVPDELLAPTHGGSVNPRPDPADDDELDQDDPIEE